MSLPFSPGPGEVTVDVAFAGTGFVDTLFRSGALPVPMPFVPGIEVTGTIREVGEGATDLAPGDAAGALLNDFGRGWRVGGELRAAAFGQLAPFGRQIILGNATGDDPPMSGDGIWHGSRTVSGLSLGATAHLVAPRIQAALSGLVDLLARGALDEPAPAVAALGDAAAVHQAFADRTAPPKTVLDVSA